MVCSMTDAALSPSPADDFWIPVREAYLAGETATVLCRAFDLAPSTFWSRASREGWLRRNQPARDRAARPIDLAAPVDDLATALDKAWRRIIAALDADDPAAAVRWTRVHAQLKATAVAQGLASAEAARRASRDNSLDQLRVTDSLARAAKAELALAKALWPRSTREPSQRLEKVESVSPDSNPPTVATADRPLSRAERRRQKRLGGGP
jgi:hypothetical protein